MNLSQKSNTYLSIVLDLDQVSLDTTLRHNISNQCLTKHTKYHTKNYKITTCTFFKYSLVLTEIFQIL